MSKEEPKNQEDQSPTRTPEETRERLEQKAGDAQGETNRARIEKKLDQTA